MPDCIVGNLDPSSPASLNRSSELVVQMQIRKAKPSEAELLSNLSIRSKAFWGYDREFLIDATEDLAITPSDIEEGSVFVFESDRTVVGYYAFDSGAEPEMTALFVDPEYIGKGVGLKLWQHSLQHAVNKGWTKFKIVADPFAAEKFYLRVGCKQVGEFQSPVREDRKLPLLEYDLTQGSSKPDRLYHVSEIPDIDLFLPRPPPNRDAGIEVDAVWTITDYELPNYLLPRDCPRVCYRDNRKRKIIAIEEGWVERIKNAAVFLYEFDPLTFLEIDPVAGYWISREEVRPLSVTKFDNILERLTEMEVSIKVLPHLHDEKDMVVQNKKHFSVIRFRNAVSAKL